MSPLPGQAEIKKAPIALNDERLCSNKGYTAFYKELRNRCATDTHKKSLQFPEFVETIC